MCINSNQHLLYVAPNIPFWQDGIWKTDDKLWPLLYFQTSCFLWVSSSQHELKAMNKNTPFFPLSFKVAEFLFQNHGNYLMFHSHFSSFVSRFNGFCSWFICLLNSKTIGFNIYSTLSFILYCCLPYYELFLRVVTFNKQAITGKWLWYPT